MISNWVAFNASHDFVLVFYLINKWAKSYIKQTIRGEKKKKKLEKQKNNVGEEDDYGGEDEDLKRKYRCHYYCYSCCLFHQIPS